MRHQDCYSCVLAWYFPLVWRSWMNLFGLGWLLCQSLGLGSIELWPAKVYVVIFLVPVLHGRLSWECLREKRGDGGGSCWKQLSFTETGPIWELLAQFCGFIDFIWLVSLFGCDLHERKTLDSEEETSFTILVAPPSSKLSRVALPFPCTSNMKVANRQRSQNCMQDY